jgi:hypothetical protein
MFSPAVEKGNENILAVSRTYFLVIKRIEYRHPSEHGPAVSMFYLISVDPGSILLCEFRHSGNSFANFLRLARNAGLMDEFGHNHIFTKFSLSNFSIETVIILT